MKSTHALVAAALTLAAASPLRAQDLPIPVDEGDPSAGLAYLALTSSPLGALPPWLSPRFTGAASPRVGFRTLFGHIDESGPISRRAFGVGADLPFAGSTIGLMVAYQDVACDEDELLGGDLPPGFDFDCAGVIMGGASWGLPLLSGRVGSGQGSTINLGLDLSAGYGSGDLVEASFEGAELRVGVGGLSAAVGVPVSLAATSGSISIVPHLTPRLGYGRGTLELEATGVDGEPPEDDEVTESDMRFMLGGGVDLLFAGGLGFTVGFQKVFIEDGKTLLGLGMTFNVR